MAQIKYTTIMRDFKGRYARSNWLRERIPSGEFIIASPRTNDDDGWDDEDNIETTVTIWHEDAERIITEFWFRFP